MSLYPLRLHFEDRPLHTACGRRHRRNRKMETTHLLSVFQADPARCLACEKALAALPGKRHFLVCDEIERDDET